MNPNRKPAGTSTGGQFAPGNHPESSVTLDEERRAPLTPTEAMRDALEQLLPGGFTPELSDADIRGPRGGLRGYRCSALAWRPGIAMLTKAVCTRGYCSETIEHGHSFWYERGGPGKLAETQFTGPTFRDTPEVRATIAALYDLSRERRYWPGGLDLDECRARIAAELEAEAERSEQLHELTR